MRTSLYTIVAGEVEKSATGRRSRWRAMSVPLLMILVGETASKRTPDRIVAMLTKPGQRGYAVHEDQAQYAVGIDTDPDTD